MKKMKISNCRECRNHGRIKYTSNNPSNIIFEVTCEVSDKLVGYFKQSEPSVPIPEWCKLEDY